MRKDAETLEEKLERLETRNRLMFIVALLCAVVLLMGALPDREPLRVQSVQLVNETGVVVAELGVRDGNVGLYLDDEHSQNRIALFHSPEGTGMYIKDREGVTRIGVAQFAHGGGGIALHGEKSRGAAVLYFKDAGSLRFFDAEGNVTNDVKAQRSVSAQ